MNWLLKTEKVLFYFFIAAAFWQWRLVWPRDNGFNEWTAFFLYATDIVLAAIFILWLARKALSAERRVPSEKKDSISAAENIVLGLFLLFCALSLFVALDKGLAFFRFIKLAEFTGLYFYVRYNFNALYNLKRLWQWFIAGAALQSVVAIVQFSTQKSLGLKFFAESPLAPNLDGAAKIVVDGEKVIRAYGLVPHPNILAAILVVAIFGLVWLWLERKKDRHSDPAVAGEESLAYASKLPAFAGDSLGKTLGTIIKRTLFIIVFILLSVALFFTFSRGVIIVGGVLFLFWLASLWRQKEYRRTIISILLLFAICYSLLAIVCWPYVSSRYDPAALPGSQAIDLRVFYNEAAWGYIEAYPWLGVGLGNFTAALRAGMVLPDWQYQPAHNLYLLVAAENGVPAFLAFLAFLFLTVRSAWISRRNLETGYWLFAISYLLIIGLFDHFLWDLQQGQILFWLPLGLLAASLKKQDAEKI